jgi:hypothetical protein
MVLVSAETCSVVETTAGFMLVCNGFSAVSDAGDVEGVTSNSVTFSVVEKFIGVDSVVTSSPIIAGVTILSINWREFTGVWIRFGSKNILS